MYYIFKLSGIWAMYDIKQGMPRPITGNEAGVLIALFSPLLDEDGQLLKAIKVTDIQAPKLKSKIRPGSYINKFDNIWAVSDGGKQKSKVLGSSEVELIVSLFPALFEEEGIFQMTIHATTINPNKLVNLPMIGLNPVQAKKTA